MSSQRHLTGHDSGAGTSLVGVERLGDGQRVLEPGGQLLHRLLQIGRLRPGRQLPDRHHEAARTEHPDEPAARKARLAPGVQPGDRVEAGDKLVLLESMKMVIPITAPHDGRVSKVHCRPGDSVPAGAPLLEIESE